MPVVTINQLIEAGVHYGHGTARWNPKMKPYIFGVKNKVHIIDLKATIRGLVRACYFLRKQAADSAKSDGAQFLFVGTKRQARDIVRREAGRCGMHFVEERWLGGCLTNHGIVTKRIAHLESLEQMFDTGSIRWESKKQQAVLAREKRKMLRNLDGIRRLKRIPDVMVVIDPKKEKTAIAEANKLDIPVVALADTDSDPDLIDLVIPGNDDAGRSVEIMLKALVDAIMEGRKTWEAHRGARLPAAPAAAAAPAAPAVVSDRAEEAPEVAPVKAAPKIGPKKKIVAKVKTTEERGAYVSYDKSIDRDAPASGEKPAPKPKPKPPADGEAGAEHS